MTSLLVSKGAKKMKKMNKILFAIAAIVLMVAVSGQAATSMYFGDAAGTHLTTIAAGGHVCIWLAANPDNGTVFEAMVGYDTTAATTQGPAARANASTINLTNVLINATLFPNIDTSVPRQVKDDVAAREASNGVLGGRPWGKKIIGGFARGFNPIPGVPSKLAEFDVTATTAGNIVLSDNGSGNSYTTAWKKGTTAYPCSDSIAVTASALPAPTLVSAVSRKTHTGVGDFNIPLALAGTSVECRTGGPTKVILTFDQAVSKAAGFAVLATNATYVSSTTVGSTLEIILSGVADHTWVAIGVSGLQGAGTLEGTYALTVGALYGDVNFNKSVNAADSGQVKLKSGFAVGATTFQYDVNANGSINAADAGQVKLMSGHTLP